MRTTVEMRPANPAVRSVSGPGMAGNGAHVFQCADCSGGVVIYDSKGNRKDHIRRIPAADDHISFDVFVYCNTGRPQIEHEVTGRVYADVFRAAVAFALS